MKHNSLGDWLSLSDEEEEVKPTPIQTHYAGACEIVPVVLIVLGIILYKVFA